MNNNLKDDLSKMFTIKEIIKQHILSLKALGKKIKRKRFPLQNYLQSDET